MKPLPIWPRFDEAKPHAFFSTAARVYNAFRRRGLSIRGSIAMMTQADMESWFQTDALGDHGQAHNLFQWWWSPRGSNILQATGIDVRTETSIDKIVEAAWWELNNTHTHALKLIEASTNAAEASRAACVSFEGAGAADAAERRAKEAERWTVFIGNHNEWVGKQG